MKPDFSNLSVITATIVGRRCERGLQATDEMLLEAFERTVPPLLSELDTKVALSVLRGKSGRPPRKLPPRERVSERILNCDRTDVPKQFLQALSSRLVRKKGLKDVELSMRFQRKINRQVRDNHMRGLYHQFLALLDDSDHIHHPQLGIIDVPTEPMTPSQKAMTMTAYVLTQMMDLDAPEYGRMLNIISKK